MRSMDVYKLGLVSAWVMARGPGIFDSQEGADQLGITEDEFMEAMKIIEDLQGLPLIPSVSRPTNYPGEGDKTA